MDEFEELIMYHKEKAESRLEIGKWKEILLKYYNRSNKNEDVIRAFALGYVMGVTLRKILE